MGETTLILLTALGAALAVIGLALFLFRPRRETDERLAQLMTLQAETAGRLQAMGEALGGRQAELARVLAERLDGVSHRLGQSMAAM